jgi:hypothetical protein
MSPKPIKLTDEELVQACRDMASQGGHYVDSSLSGERSEILDYYNGDRPFPLKEGGSKFVSQDVYVAVEAQKAEIVETFSAGSNIVKFSPVGPEDITMAKHATAYCSMAIHEQNNAMTVFSSVTHDGLLHRNGVVEVLWEKREFADPQEFTDVPAEAVSQIMQDPTVKVSGKLRETPQPDGTVLYSGTFDRIEDLSRVRIDPVPPEEFIISGFGITSLDEAPYLARRYQTTLGDLVAEGYDKAAVYAITDEGDDEFDMETEKADREPGSLWNHRDTDDMPDAASRKVVVHRSYIKIDALGLGYQQTWMVCHVGSTLLKKYRVREHPFVGYAPKPIPHTWYGDNYAKRVIPHANTKTTLTRAIIEQAVDATNPRWMVARGGIANPRELIDNRRGGVVNVRSLSDSVAPLPQHQINPYVLQTIGMIDSDRENTTGVSKLSQGLEKEALGSQNSKGLVQEMRQAGQTRTKVAARHFAHQFLVPLYLKVYAVALANETKEHMLQIDGSYQQVSPAKWSSRRAVSVDFTLGYGERDKSAEELLIFDRYATSNGIRGYDEARRYNLLSDVLAIKGYRDVNRYLANPETLQPPEPDQKAQAELAEIEKKTEVAERQMALREWQVQQDAARKDADVKRKIEETTFKQEMELREQDRKDAEIENKIDVSLAELELAADMQAQTSAENTKSTAIISPN